MFENIKISAATEVAWGRLVKTWATGKSNFPAVSVDKLPVPRTLEDLKAQCALVGVEITIPAKITGLAIIQPGPETLALRLPAKSMVEAAEADLDQGLDVHDPALLHDLLRSTQCPARPAQRLPGLPDRRLFDRQSHVIEERPRATASWRSRCRQRAGPRVRGPDAVCPNRLARKWDGPGGTSGRSPGRSMAPSPPSVA